MTAPDATQTIEPTTGARRPSPTTLAIGGGLLVAIVLLSLGTHRGVLTVPKAILLGAVEGITEFLPISSTGHLLVVQRLLDLGEGAGKVAADTYAIAIQLGAIVAVIAVYRRHILQLLQGLVGRSEAGRRLLIRLVVAFLPAAIIGAALEHPIKDHLFGPWPVVGAWAVGGAFLLWWKPRHGTTTLDAISIRSAAIIGVAQALALWPGVSRSLVTLVAALLLGCEIGAAVEFSFLLGLATLSAATALDLTKDGDTLVRDYGYRTPVLGALVAFGTAVLAVRWLIGYLRTRPLTIFGWYRLLAAAVTIVLIATNAI